MPHDNYYSDDEVQPKSDKASAERGDTALLPKSFLGGSTQPGDTITLRVERILDDQIEVCKESYKEEEEPEERMPMPPEGMGMGAGMGMGGGPPAGMFE